MIMKRMIFLILTANVSMQLSGQTFDEWFNQSKTQITYLLQQIAANDMYIEYLQKGYEIADKGLKAINDIKQGDLNLHADYFSSLKSVNPKISSWAKVAAIFSLQASILKRVQATVRHIKASGEFTPAEISYMEKVFDQLLEGCVKVITHLTNIITAGQSVMTDDERIKRIDSIYDDMQDKLSFSKAFAFDASLLEIQREQERMEATVSRKLRGLP